MNTQPLVPKVSDTTQMILNIFESFRMQSTAIDEYHQGGKDKLAQRIEYDFVSKGKILKFSMLGFPMKSTNDRDKVLGRLPDMAEQVTLENFASFNKAILNVYPQGVKFSMISDGYVFNDLLQAEDIIVERYEEVSKEMSYQAKSPVCWYDLRNFYDGNLYHLPSMREKVINQFGITNEELEKRILFDPNTNALYRGMVRFMNEELANRNYPSGNQLQKAAKILARQMMFRNEAYSKLVQTEFSDHIRLSMHPSTNNGTKYSFQLIPAKNGEGWASPWHCALLVKQDGGYASIHKKDAELAGYELIKKEGRGYYFQQA